MTRERAEGAILGAACGDALGAWTESLTPSAIAARFSGLIEDFPDIRNEYLRNGMLYRYTDDTQLCICVAQSLIEKAQLDIDDVAVRFIAWAREAQNTHMASRTILRAIGNLRAGIDPKHSGLPSSCGAGLARVIPVGLFYAGEVDQCLVAVRKLATITHNDPLSDAGSAATALFTGFLSRELSFEESLSTTIEIVSSISAELAERLRLVRACADYDDTAAFNLIGRGGGIHEIVPAAVYCLMKHPDDLRMTVLTAVNNGGKSDSIASLAGAFAGAHLGVRAIPPGWLSKLDQLDRLKETAAQLEVKRQEKER